ncbi:hypothetical protein FGG08_006372 [Glutinoglossum americanum]|uniref:Uncharacterized protein n=1 Tax=Glutinoglossum americanum TaxID=1670608 RepID=A0A9P8I3K2_9PEZI|nr:hypothetical protein FGG08_006372 [Glutinoglossum americanum]
MPKVNPSNGGTEMAEIDGDERAMYEAERGEAKIEPDTNWDVRQELSAVSVHEIPGTEVELQELEGRGPERPPALDLLSFLRSTSKVRKFKGRKERKPVMVSALSGIFQLNAQISLAGRVSQPGPRRWATYKRLSVQAEPVSVLGWPWKVLYR